MDYIITFADDSQALMHYGVMGMKWGKWNAETQRRYAGAGNGTYFKKAQRGDAISRSVTDRRRAYNANQSKGKQVAKNILLTPGGAHAYNTARSRGLGRSDAAVASLGGVFYAQGVKRKQGKLGTKDPMVSKAAKERSDYENGESFGKFVAKEALLGPVGAMNYNSVKARTKSRGKAAVAGVLSSAIPAVAGSAAGAALGTAASTAANAALVANGASNSARLAGMMTAASVGGQAGSYAGQGAAYAGNAKLLKRKGYDKNVRSNEFRRENAEQHEARKEREKRARAYS